MLPSGNDASLMMIDDRRSVVMVRQRGILSVYWTVDMYFCLLLYDDNGSMDRAIWPPLIAI